jgi:acyl dehydratase
MSIRLSTHAIGRVFAELEFEPSPRMTMAYAAGIGAGRSCYMADDAPGGIIAPPAFCVSAEWRVLTDPRYFEALGLPTDALWRGIHVEQDTRFEAPVRPGMHLIVSGRLDATRATRAGALVEVTLVIRDARTDRLVTVTRWTAIYRGVEADPAGKRALGVEGAASDTPHGSMGEAASATEIPIAPWLPHVYTECAGIWNPIHTERRYAARLGLPDILLHGTATWAIVGEALIDGCAGGNPAMLKRLKCRFMSPVWPGTKLSLVRSPVTPQGSATFECRGGDGLVLAGGVVEVVPAASAPIRAAAPRPSARNR